MIYINHDIKSIYIRIPKTGGKFISNILQEYYGFSTTEYRRDDIVDFFDDEDGLLSSLTYYDGKVHSIRKNGIIKYYSDNDNDIINYKHIGLSKEQWDSYYKFTFVSNPYSRIINSYLYCKNRIFPDETIFKKSNNDDDSFSNFINNKNNQPNLIYFTTFINQCEHLLDYDNNINLQFIGTTENINQDLIIILKHLNFKQMKHLIPERINDLFPYEYIPININYADYLDENILLQINKLFEKDFIYFNFKNIEKDIGYKKANMLFEYNKKQICENIKNNSLDILSNNIDVFIENIEKIYNISSTNAFHNQYKILFKKINTYIKEITKVQSLLINDNVNEITTIDKTAIKCNNCNNCTFNYIAENAHNINCIACKLCNIEPTVPLKLI